MFLSFIYYNMIVSLSCEIVLLITFLITLKCDNIFNIFHMFGLVQLS